MHVNRHDTLRTRPRECLGGAFVAGPATEPAAEPAAEPGWAVCHLACTGALVLATVLAGDALA